MTSPLPVSDLRFLNQLALYDIERPSNKSVAYYAGLLSAFRIALKFNESKVEMVAKVTYECLMGQQRKTCVESVDLAKVVWAGTSPKVNLPLGIFEDFGLSHGGVGDLYYMGMKNAVTVAMLQVPTNFMLTQGKEWRVAYESWLRTQLNYIEFDLKMEKTLRAS